MQVSVENLSSLERRVTVQFPIESLQENIQKRLSELQKKAVINGFRPGKVPPKLITERFGRQIKEEVAEEHINTIWKDALQQANCEPACTPSAESFNFDLGEQVECKLWCEVVPTIELKDLETLEIEKSVASITDEDVDTEIKETQPNEGELNEDFFKSVDPNIKDLQGLKDHVRKQMESNLEHRSKRVEDQNICKAVLEAHPLPELPKTQVAEALSKLEEDYWHLQKWLYRSSQKGELPKAIQEHLETKARSQVALNLIIKKILHAHAIQVDEKEVQAALEAHSHECEEKEHDYEQMQREMHERFLQKKLFDTIKARAKSVEKHYSYKEFMKL